MGVGKTVPELSLDIYLKCPQTTASKCQKHAGVQSTILQKFNEKKMLESRSSSLDALPSCIPQSHHVLGGVLGFGKTGSTSPMHLSCWSSVVFPSDRHGFSIHHSPPWTHFCHFSYLLCPWGIRFGDFIFTSRKWNKDTLHIKVRQLTQKMRFYGATCVGEMGHVPRQGREYCRWATICGRGAGVQRSRRLWAAVREVFFFFLSFLI